MKGKTMTRRDLQEQIFSLKENHEAGRDSGWSANFYAMLDKKNHPTRLFECEVNFPFTSSGKLSEDFKTASINVGEVLWTNVDENDGYAKGDRIVIKDYQNSKTMDFDKFYNFCKKADKIDIHQHDACYIVTLEKGDDYFKTRDYLNSAITKHKPLTAQKAKNQTQERGR